jgi:hypothetical protein
MKLILRTFILSFILIVTLAANAYAGNKDSLDILFIGNSYTHMNDMPNIFDKIAKAKGKSVHVEMNTRSGSSFNVHTTREDMFKVIKSRKWDYIVLQGYSRELSFDYTIVDTASIPFVNKILDTIYINNPCTNVLFYATWGYKNGYLERDDVNTYEKMADKIIDGYKYMSEIFNIPLVPVGLVWKEIRKNYPSLNLYDKDEAHPNRNGSYLAACTFYSAIFHESSVGAVTSTISSKNAEIIQLVASNYVMANLNSLKLNMNTWDVNDETTKDTKYVAHCSATFPNATAITWNFGDGRSTTKSSADHLYNKPGRYKVKLTVEDACGIRYYSKIITFEKPKKPLKNLPSKPIIDNSTVKKI